MKSVLVGIGAGLLVVASDVLLFGWSRNDLSMRLGLAVVVFLVTTAATGVLTGAWERDEA